MTNDPNDHVDDDPGDELAGFPVLMVYSTTRLSRAGGWTNNTRIVTPDGKATISGRQNAGGNLIVGMRKSVKWLDDALLVAEQELSDVPF